MTCRTPCDGCALTLNSAANKEPLSRLKATLAVLGPSPFYCHDTIENWRDVEDYSPQNRKELLAGGMKPCVGWLREVKNLAESGYYKNREETRLVAQYAANLLNFWASEESREDPKKRGEALEAFGELLKELRDVYRDFVPVESDLNRIFIGDL